MACRYELLLLILILSSCLIDAALKEQPKIVIVGAGLSGLSAATKLAENGFTDITILEAENRIGGRIYSTKFSTGYVDLGAQWVHGAKNNVIYEITNGKYEFGVTGFDDKLPIFLQSNAVPVDQSKCKNFATVALETLFSNYKEMSEFPGSIGEYVNLKFKSSAAYKSPGDQHLGEQMIDYFEKEMNIWNGSKTWYDLSAQFHCVSGFNEGLQYFTWNQDGFKEFFKYLTNQNSLDISTTAINVMDKIILNQEVTNIEWNNPESNYVTIIVNNRRKYFADHVIVTASLGVLKDRHQTLFTPKLPKTLRIAINAMGFGNIGKIFFEFDDPFWPKDSEWVAYGFLWTKDDIAAIKGTDREWLLDLQAFTKVDKFPNVIEALLAGYKMETFENLESDKVLDDCMWMLQKFLGNKLPRPKSMIKTKWLTNRHFLGSYSYYSMKAGYFNVTAHDLSETLYNYEKSKPQVLFAGEHTDPLYSSNAHGAVNSGKRAANEIIEYYQTSFNHLDSHRIRAEEF